MKMKKKLFIPLIAALLTIGLTSVGFAAWVITGAATATTNEGTQFTAHEVRDARIQFTATFTDKAVNFAAPSGHGAANWLQFDGNATEDLNATMKITITNWADVKGRTITFEVPAPTTTVTGLETYVNFPTARTITITPDNAEDPKAWTVNGLASGSYTVNASGAELTVPFEFTWGSAFGSTSTNPFTYYNNISNPSNTDISNAKTALEKIYELNGESFQITVTGKTQ